MKIKFKKIKISASSLSQILHKNKHKINKEEKCSNKNNSIKNNKSLEQVEYGYELEESSGNNSQISQDNNMDTSLLREKSNGEKKIIIQNMNNNKEIKREFISMPMTKINLNQKYKTNKRNKNNIENNSNFLCHKSFNNNGLIHNKYNNIEIENSDWNNTKINFDGISAVSRGNSYENNDNSNIIDNNYFNSQNLNNNDTLLKSENFGLMNSINIDKEIKNIKDVSLSQNINKNIPYNKINKQNNKKSFNINKNNNLIDKEKNTNRKNNQNIINKCNKEKNELKSKLEEEKTVSKEKNDYFDIVKQMINNNLLKDKNISFIKEINNQNIDLIIEFSKYKNENIKLKKSIIMQSILTNDMKNELQNLKNDKKNLEEEIAKYKNDSNIMKQKLNDYEIKIKQNKTKEEDLKLNLNKQKNLNYEVQKEINALKQKNEDLIEINEKISKNKCVINIEEKTSEDYRNIIQEKNNMIKELKNENLNLMKEIDLKEKKIEKLLENKEDNIYLNNDLKTKELEIYSIKTNETYINKILDNSFEIIKEISNNIQMYINIIKENYLKVSGADIILFELLKEIIDKFNNDNNGNISMNEKLKIIKDFINIIKINIEKIFNHIKNYYQNSEINNKENVHKNNNLISPNGQNNVMEKIPKTNIAKRNITRINSYNEKYLSNDIFKKIDLNLNLFNTHASENNRIFKYNNRFKAIKSNLRSNKLKHNNTTNCQDKKSTMFTSSFSPLNKEVFIHPANEKILNKKYDDFVDSIFNENKNERKTKLSLRVKELTDLINRQNSNNKNNNTENLFIQNIKKSKINLSEETDSNTIFPSNETINKKKNEIIFAMTNINSIRRNNRELFYKSTLEGNSKKNINSKISNYFSSNHKKTISTSNNYINSNIHINNFEKIDLGKTIPQSKNSINHEKTSTINIESNILNNISFNNENSVNKVGNNSSSILETMKSNNIKNHKKRLEQKILIKHKILEKENNKNNIDINGLANEFLKPSFLKNISLNKTIENKNL